MNQISGNEKKTLPSRILAGGYKFFRDKLSLRTTVLLYILLALAIAKAVNPLPLQIVQQKVFDIYQLIKPRVERNYPVIIADIDEASLKAYGQWPWPRTRAATRYTDPLRRTIRILIRG